MDNKQLGQITTPHGESLLAALHLCVPLLGFLLFVCTLHEFPGAQPNSFSKAAQESPCGDFSDPRPVSPRICFLLGESDSHLAAGQRQQRRLSSSEPFFQGTKPFRWQPFWNMDSFAAALCFLPVLQPIIASGLDVRSLPLAPRPSWRGLATALSPPFHLPQATTRTSAFQGIC